MKNKKIITLILAITMLMTTLVGCSLDVNSSSYTIEDEIAAQQEVTTNLVEAQPTPKDISYSLERYNLIRRAYWVNGQREKANMLVCEVEKPLGYITLFTESGAIVGTFVVDGKVSSLNSFLTPDSEYYEQDYGTDGCSYGDGNDWLADVDGSYGTNDNGIFFFTPDGNYIEWTGTYLYTDIPMHVEEPVIKFDTTEKKGE